MSITDEVLLVFIWILDFTFSLKGLLVDVTVVDYFGLKAYDWGLSKKELDYNVGIAP